MPVKGRGCRTCSETGFKGRIALYEVMELARGAQGVRAERRLGARAQARGDPARHADAAQERARKSSRTARRRSPKCSASRPRTTSRSRIAMANMHQLLKAMIEKGASDLHITTGTRAAAADRRQAAPAADAAAVAARDEAALLLGAHRLAEAPVRGEERARPLVLRAEAVALPRQRLRAARQRRGRVPRDPVQDQDVRGARAAEDRRRISPRSRAA